GRRREDDSCLLGTVAGVVASPVPGLPEHRLVIEGGCVVQRRLVGIDLGIASAHTVRVLDEGGREVCRRRCEPTVASLAVIEAAALGGAEQGTRLVVGLDTARP